MLTIYIDADACPVKDEVYKVCASICTEGIRRGQQHHVRAD